MCSAVLAPWKFYRGPSERIFSTVRYMQTLHRKSLETQADQRFRTGSTKCLHNGLVGWIPQLKCHIQFVVHVSDFRNVLLMVLFGKSDGNNVEFQLLLFVVVPDVWNGLVCWIRREECQIQGIVDVSTFLNVNSSCCCCIRLFECLHNGLVWWI